MFIWALANWRIIALILAVLAALGALWYYGHTKYRQGWDECTVKQEKAEIEGVKNRDTIKTKINRYKPSDVDQRLIDRWLRDE